MGFCNLLDVKKLRIGLALTGFSLFAILILRIVRIPFMDPNGNASGVAAFVVMGLIFLYFIKRFNLPTLAYFGLPTKTFASFIALVIASTTNISQIFKQENEMKPWKVAIPGFIFLLSVGFGEEMVSRGFVFGVLKARSLKAAIFISALLFGLMHLNLYVGHNWDPWLAYWHVASAFCFGVFICAVMVATQSIWVAVLFHALADWNLVFAKVSSSHKKVPPVSISFWEGLASPAGDVIFLLLPALLILFLHSKRRIWLPNFVRRAGKSVAERFKLLEDEAPVLPLASD